MDLGRVTVVVVLVAVRGLRHLQRLLGPLLLLLLSLLLVVLAGAAVMMVVVAAVVVARLLGRP
jgi:hypothetical protein